MAVTRTLQKGTARLKLNNGTDPSTGQVRTVNQSMPSLTPEYTPATDDEKLMAVIEALVPCLTKSVYSVEYIATYMLAD